MNAREQLFGYNDKEFSQEQAFSTCLYKVYGWMAIALAISGLTAWKIANSPDMMQKIFGTNSGIVYGIVIVELLLVIGLSGFINKLQSGIALLLFFVYAALNGVTCSAIFWVYTKESLTSAFLTTAGTFAACAIFGTVTKRNLSVLGRVLFMGLIGLIIASVVNIWLKNEGMNLFMTYMGVILFTGLTAYDSWKIRKMFEVYDTSDREMVNKYAVIGALQLYLDFINLFLYILRVMGRKK